MLLVARWACSAARKLEIQIDSVKVVRGTEGDGGLDELLTIVRCGHHGRRNGHAPASHRNESLQAGVLRFETGQLLVP